MIENNMQKIERFPIDDSLVHFALNAQEDYLKPGKEHFVIEDIAKSFDDVEKDRKQVIIYTLTEEQKKKFANEYSLPTPLKYTSIDSHRLTRLSLLQVAFSLNFGTPFGLPDQRDGAIVQDIFPKDDKTERINSSFGSKEDFAFHTDQSYNANLSEVPSFIILSCIRNEEGGITRTIHLSEILSYLKQEDIDILKQPYFKFYTGRPDENIAVRTGPVLTDVEGVCTIRVATDMMSINAGAEAALLLLRKIMKEKADDIVLNSGDILVIPNKTSVHSRSPFTPNSHEDKRRWLQRVFVK